MIQLGSEAPVMSMDANGHVMLCDNGDIRASLVQNLKGDAEETVDLHYKDISEIWVILSP